MTAVYGIAAAGADGSPVAVRDAYRAALVVPVVMVLLGAVSPLSVCAAPGPPMGDGRARRPRPATRSATALRREADGARHDRVVASGWTNAEVAEWWCTARERAAPALTGHMDRAIQSAS
ncbi:hypothetical protein [Streptomyces sp. NPDC055134]